MDRPLNQEEFNALLQMVEGRRAQAPEESARDQTAVPLDLRRAGMLAKEQVQAIRSLHETFARNFTASLGPYLQGSFETALAAVEQLPYSEFIRRIPELSYVGSIALHPLEATAAIELDQQVALPVIDMLLGGTGGPPTEVREVTEIEEEILGSVVELICSELQVAWEPVLKVDFRCGRRQGQAHDLRFMSPKERVLCISLEVRTAEARGMLNLAFPAVAVNALLKEFDRQASSHGQPSAPAENRRLRSLLEKCRFRAELLSPTAPISTRRLVHLKVGELLEFPFNVAEPAWFKVENKTLFLAQPVAIGDRRAAEIHLKLATPQTTQEEPR